MKVETPKAVYAGIHVNSGGAHIACTLDRKTFELDEFVSIGTDISSTIVSWLSNYERQKGSKFVAAGVSGNSHRERLFDKLWLATDIVPISTNGEEQDPKTHARKNALIVASYFDEYHAHPAQVKKNSKVNVFPLASLSSYEELTPPSEFQTLISLADRFLGKRVNFYSATPQGGGVALMRHALMRLYKRLGVKSSWYVMTEDPAVFDITKIKFHNVFQDVNGDSEIHLTKEDRELFSSWSAKNARRLRRSFEESDVVVIDDPQPSGLVPHVKKTNPKAKIIYRSHIQLIASLADKRGTASNTSWQFVSENIKGHDLFIAHPKKEFVPKNVDRKKLVYMGATTDPLDGLNKNLPNGQQNYYMRFVNKFLTDSGQAPLDHTRPFIVQIARFDPSKGIPDTVEAFGLLCGELSKTDRPLPQLVIAGNASVDDPDGLPIYTATINLINSSRFAHLSSEIKIIRLPHYDQLLNTLLRRATIALQLSHKEGFEVKISEALMKGIPTIVYGGTGAELQVKEGAGGHVVQPGDTQAVSRHMFNLLTQKGLYMRMSDEAEKSVPRDVLTVKNAIAWLYLASKLAEDGSLAGNGAYVHDLIASDNLSG